MSSTAEGSCRHAAQCDDCNLYYCADDSMLYCTYFFDHSCNHIICHGCLGFYDFKEVNTKTRKTRNAALYICTGCVPSHPDTYEPNPLTCIQCDVKIGKIGFHVNKYIGDSDDASMCSHLSCLKSGHNMCWIKFMGGNLVKSFYVQQEVQLNSYFQTVCCPDCWKTFHKGIVPDSWAKT